MKTTIPTTLIQYHSIKKLMHNKMTFEILSSPIFHKFNILIYLIHSLNVFMPLKKNHFDLIKLNAKL